MARVRIYQDSNTGIYGIRVNQENMDSAGQNSPWRLLGDFDIDPDEGIFMQPSCTGGAELRKWIPPSRWKKTPEPTEPKEE